MAEGLAANHHPPELATTMAPRLIELCLQTAGLWEIGARGTLGLPRHIGSVSLLSAPESADGRLFAIVTPHPETGEFDAAIVDASGNRYLHLRGYGTVTLASGVNAEPMRVLNGVAPV
jgi:hypothetical protein